MALGIKEFLSAPIFSSTFTPNPLNSSWITGIIFKIHTMTGTLLFLLSCFVYARELLGDHIHCITDSSDAIGGMIPQKAFESYCYISNTFTLPKQVSEKYGTETQIHPGVGPIGINSREEHFYHNYYMWVPYLLFLQSLSFFLPFALHSFFQDGRVQLLLSELQNLYVYPDVRDDKYGDINLYFKDWYNHQDWWAIKLVICEMLHLIVIVLNILLVDWYLGNEFYTYGISAIHFIATNVEKRGMDPFNLLFPKMTKCTLNTYGPSGTIQNMDGLCVLPINVLNEKIFLFLWFLFLFLAFFTIVYTLLSGVILMVQQFRNGVLLFYISPDRHLLRKKLIRILSLTGFGDWMVLYLIAKNTDRVLFSQLVQNLNYPDYRHDLEPYDEENKRLDRLIEKDDNESIEVETYSKEKSNNMFKAFYKIKSKKEIN